MGTIYGLCDPDGTLRYVGQTGNVQGRYKSHLRQYRSNSRKDVWVQSLRKEGLLPLLKILESDVPNEDLRQRENAWISKMRAEGCDLTNAIVGQGYQSAETRAKRSAALRGRPWSSKRWQAYKPREWTQAQREFASTVHRGKKMSADARARQREAKAADRAVLRGCPFCSGSFSGHLGLSIHVTKTHKVVLRHIVRIAFEAEPEQTRALLAQIDEGDRELTRLTRQLEELRQ